MKNMERGLWESITGRPNLDCGIKEGLSEEVVVKLDLKGT